MRAVSGAIAVVSQAEENPVRVIDVFVDVPDPESLADRLAILPHC